MGDRLRKENDFYPTPHSICSAIVKNWSASARVIWEPCYGDGRLAKILESAGYTVGGSDIRDGDDFFRFKYARSPIIVTNPPFGVIRLFIDHAFKIGVKEMVLVCPERLWACKRGAEQFNRHRPSKWVNLSWREDYLGKGGAPDRALAIGIWDRPNSDNCIYEIWDKP